MKSLAMSDRYGWSRYVAHQVYYSVIGRDYEQELMPSGHRSGPVGAIVWSPSGLGAADRQDPPWSPACRRRAACIRLPPAAVRKWTMNTLYKVIDALDEVAKETG